MRLEVLIARDAERLIDDAEFRKEWRELFDRCSWSSVFQSDDFVVTWYGTYRSQFTPVLVTGTHVDGQLAGLFTLAQAAESGQLVVAGCDEAEYQAWLAEPGDGNSFIDLALEKLREEFPNGALTLLFMLPAVPVDWAQDGKRWRKHCVVRKLPRGLMEVGDGSQFQDTLRKKKQAKINRLKRLGRLHLDRIRDPEELGAVFDEITSYQTLRLKAVYNLPRVKHDPLKKTFHMNLMRHARMLHATALRVEDKLVSAQIHTYNQDQVRLGLITHSPFYSRYSPGELHTLMIGVELAKEGIQVFDLTPGGNYKDRYATHHDEVYVVNIFFNYAHCIQYKIKRRLAEAAKSALLLLHITPEQTRDAFSTFLDWGQKWLRLKPADLLSETFRSLKRRVWHADELCVYTCDLTQAHSVCDPPLKRNHIPDLLAYQPLEAWQPPVNKFLRRALENLEADQHAYTRVEDGKLVQYGWLIGPQERKPSSGNAQDPVMPADSVLLTDFYTHPQRRSLSRPSLCQMLSDAANVLGAKRAYLRVSADNRALRQLVEEMGFTYQYGCLETAVSSGELPSGAPIG